MEAQEPREVFAEEWSLAIADPAMRDDGDADELAAAGQILAAAYLQEAAAPLQPTGNRANRLTIPCRDPQSAKNDRAVEPLAAAIAMWCGQSW